MAFTEESIQKFGAMFFHHLANDPDARGSLSRIHASQFLLDCCTLVKGFAQISRVEKMMKLWGTSYALGSGWPHSRAVCQPWEVQANHRIHFPPLIVIAVVGNYPERPECRHGLQSMKSFKLATTSSVYPYKNTAQVSKLYHTHSGITHRHIVHGEIVLSSYSPGTCLMKPENDAMPQGNPSSSDPSLNKKASQKLFTKRQ